MIAEATATAAGNSPAKLDLGCKSKNECLVNPNCVGMPLAVGTLPLTQGSQEAKSSVLAVLTLEVAWWQFAVLGFLVKPAQYIWQGIE